jgi:hypothetical protein
MGRTFRVRIISTYIGLRGAFEEGNHDASGLRAGHFAETVLRFLQSHLTGSYIRFGTKIGNFASECAKLEKLPRTAGDESLRLLIPRAIHFLYSLRNKRGIGHIGGDVDANEIDAATSVRIADWCMCELIRLFHALSLEEAQAILDAISIRQLPHVWSILGKKRILHPGLDYRSQTLLLLHADVDTAIPAEDIFSWTEHSNFSNFKRDVLRPLHKTRQVEYDEDTETVIISPLGVKAVEEGILPLVRS